MPTPIRWQVPIELSPEEARVAAVLHRTESSTCFWTVRAELFDDAFQAELECVQRALLLQRLEHQQIERALEDGRPGFHHVNGTVAVSAHAARPFTRFDARQADLRRFPGGLTDGWPVPQP